MRDFLGILIDRDGCFQISSCYPLHYILHSDSFEEALLLESAQRFKRQKDKANESATVHKASFSVCGLSFLVLFYFFVQFAFLSLLDLVQAKAAANLWRKRLSRIVFLRNLDVLNFVS